MIYWFMNAPTPQFTPVLNRLTEAGVQVLAHYVDMSDRKRGWGTLEIEHPHRYERLPKVARFWRGLAAAASPSCDGVVALGYVDPLQIGALCGARLARRPIYTLSDSSLEQDRHRRTAARAIKWVLLRVLYGSRATAWVISEDNAEYWKHYGVRRQVYVPFESPVPDPPEAAQSALRLRTDVLPARDYKLILTVARLDRTKGHRVAAAAIEIMRERGILVQLIIVGAGEDEFLADAPGVTLLGSLPRHDLARAYRAADAFVLCSTGEPYGLVVREALQFGLPVVTTTGVPSAKWLCDRGWNIVPVGDAEAVADALQNAISAKRWDAVPPVDTSGFFMQELARRVR